MPYTLPEILTAAPFVGYSPTLNTAINTLVSTDNESEYKQALQTATVVISGFELSGILEDSSTGYNGLNQFGLPIYMPMVLEAIPGAKGDFILESAIVEVNRQKNITVTNLDGRDSSVKEFSSNGDFIINVSGIICSKSASYPRDSVREFIKFLDAKTSIGVVHEYLNMRGIYEIVITSENNVPSPFVNTQPYSFTALSETPIELTEI